MRNWKNLIFLLISLTCTKLMGQPIMYGLSSQSGKGAGTIVKLNGATSEAETVYSWEDVGQNPSDELTLFNGKYYGITRLGGDANAGMIFSIDSATRQFTKLISFTNVEGIEPIGALLLVNGKLYGTTTYGGASNRGAIFCYDPVGKTLKTVFTFLGYNGQEPRGALAEYNGKIYGSTTRGIGNAFYGTIFLFDPATSQHTKLHNFKDDLRGFTGKLAILNDKLYGVLEDGGNNSVGAIFSYDLLSRLFSKIYDFNLISGERPVGSLTLHNNKFYGICRAGGTNGSGTIFSFDPATNINETLFDFKDSLGTNPNGKLVIYQNKIYGMTARGGKNNFGVLYSFDLSVNTYNKLFDLANGSGREPNGGVVVSGSAILGLTTKGGKANFGTVFSFGLGSGDYQELADFTGEDGRTPTGSLVACGNTLFGTTREGGINQSGILFSFNPLSGAYYKLADFDLMLGKSPTGSLVSVGSKLYGITSAGGEYGLGTIFAFDTLSKVMSKLVDFDSTIGSQPSGSLVLHNDKLYGMSPKGGAFNRGVIFSLDLGSMVFSKAFEFDNTYQGRVTPNGGLISYGGKLYGTTAGSTLTGLFGVPGFLFSFDPATSEYRELARIIYSAGNLAASNGKLFYFVEGSTHVYDTLTKIRKSYSLEYYLRVFNGSYHVASDGNLYGMNNSGGLNVLGVIYSFDTSVNKTTVLKDLNHVIGSRPISSAFVELDNPNSERSVTISYPGNNSTIEAGSNLPVKAYAVNPGGTVSYVEFYEKGNKLWTDSVAPYSFEALKVSSGAYKVTARAYTNSGDYFSSDTVIVNVAEPCQGQGSLYGEAYINIPGGLITELTQHPSFPDQPAISGLLQSSGYTNLSDNYGIRLRGFITCVPQSGVYHFFLSVDDQAGFWISSDENPGNKRFVAFVERATGMTFWSISAGVDLVAGKKYYIEVLHKEAIGSDYFSFGWKLPDGSLELPLKASRLSPYIPSGVNSSRIMGNFEWELKNRRNESLQIRVMPNPSKSAFVVSFEGATDQLINIQVADLYGRIIETYPQRQSGSTLRVGQNWIPGVYFLRVQQGNQVETIKLIKE